MNSNVDPSNLRSSWCWVLFSFFAGLLLAASGCGAGDSIEIEDNEAELSAPSLQSILHCLEERSFQLVDWEGVEDFDSFASLMRTPLGIDFQKEGRFSAQGPVNRLMGTMSVAENGYLAVDKRIASTMMAGPEPLMELEQRLIEELASTSELVLKKTHLALVNPDGGVLHFEEAPSNANGF